MIWQVIHIADILLWLLMAGSAAYVIFFAFASLFSRKPIAVQSVSQPGDSSPRCYLIIIPAYHEDTVIRQSVSSVLSQTFPKQQYRLIVVSDNMSIETNTWLSALSLVLLQPSFEKSSKAKALQQAIEHVASTAESFTHVVILDADNLVRPDFLQQLDAVCAQGYKAIQCHRTAKNADNDIAALDGLSEEINNTLFRRAHNVVGLSSALIGSGMCFDYAWFSENVSHLNSAVEDRELESLLMRQRVFVKYEETIRVMDEKVSSQDNFKRQRMRWMTGQLQTLLLMLPYLPKALLTGNVDYVDKTIQQMLIPRSILLMLTTLLSLLFTVVYSFAPALSSLSLRTSLKWWLLLASLGLSLLIAIPSRLRTTALLQRVTSLPRLVWSMLGNLIHIDKNNKDFIHTTHDK